MNRGQSFAIREALEADKHSYVCALRFSNLGTEYIHRFHHGYEYAAQPSPTDKPGSWLANYCSISPVQLFISLFVTLWGSGFVKLRHKGPLIIPYNQQNFC